MSNSFQEKLKSYSTPTLVVIATSSVSEYREDAIEAARKELLVRGETWQDERVVAEARKEVEAEANGRGFAAFPRRWEPPNTTFGNWSLGLVGCFVALIFLLFVMLSMTKNDVILGCTLASAAGSALTAAVLATIAIKEKGERSIFMMLPLFVGGVAALFALGALVEIVVRASA